MMTLITYDIQSDIKRNKVFKTLSNYGINVQKSIFECDLKSEDVNKLYTNFEKIITPETDDLRFYIICKECNLKTIVIGTDGLKEKVKKIII